MNLRTDPVSVLIRRLAMPASVGMLFSTLMTVTDTWYAGMLSATALAALSLAGPLYFLVITLGIGIGQASNALVGNALGADRDREARHMACQVTGFAVLVSCLAGIAAFVFTPQIFAIMGGESPYIEPAVAYMRVVVLGTALFSLSLVFNALLNTQGDTRSYRNAQMLGAALNVALDPLFMFVLGLGVVGVACATVLVQALVAAYLYKRVMRLEFMTDAKLSDFRPDAACYMAILRQSLPNSLSMMLVAVGSIIIVRFVAMFGESAMAAYGVALRLEQLMLLPVIGINIACLSLTSVNHGAGLADRVRETWRGGLIHAVALMLSGGLLLLLFGAQLMRLFTSDPEVQAIGTRYLYFEAFILPAYALIFVSGSVLQGLKKPEVAMVFNVFRQVLGQLLLFWLAVVVFDLGINGIWASVLLINWVMAVVCVWFVKAYYLRSESGSEVTA